MEYISNSINENMAELKTLFKNAMDFTAREFKTGAHSGVLLSLDGMVNKQQVAISILNPILESRINMKTPEAQMFHISEKLVSTADETKIYKVNEITEKLFLGFAVLLLDGVGYGLSFGVQGFERRSVKEPENEVMQQGSKEGFVEAFLVNISLIRRRMRNTELKFEMFTVGSESKTPIVLCYLENKVSEKLLSKIKEQINKIKLKNVLAAGYLSGFLKRSSFFGNIGVTERPDTLCGKIAEGRVGILIDGTPNAIIVPHLFIENFQTLDDYANRPMYATFTRWIRFIAFFIAVFLPGIYAAVVIHRPELIPDMLLSKIAAEEASTPFSVMWELLLVNLLYEIMREAGLRAPKSLGQAVSIVGALVIGDTAVQSGLIGATSLMVIASSAISGYAIQKLYEQLSLIRFMLVIAGGVFGVWGLIVVSVFLIYNICSEENFGIPVTSPLAPFSFKLLRDTFIRAPWRVLQKNRMNVSDLPGIKEIKNDK